MSVKKEFVHKYLTETPEINEKSVLELGFGIVTEPLYASLYFE